MKLVVIFIVGFLINANGQDTIKERVFTYLKNGSKDPILFNKLLKDPKQELVYAALTTYVSDSLNKNRVGVIQLIKSVERKIKDPIFRKGQLAVIFTALNKMPIKETKESISLMCKYEKSCFTEEQIMIIRNYMFSQKAERKTAALLLGVLGVKEDIGYLNLLEGEKSIRKEELYSISLAKVRLKDGTATTDYLSKFNLLSIDDNFTTNVLKDAVYTRNRDVISVLLKACLSEEANCMSSNNDATEKIPCAYRIIEALAPVVIDFPVKIDRSGEIIGSPEEALQKAKEWIVLHSNDFLLNETVF